GQSTSVSPVGGKTVVPGLQDNPQADDVARVINGFTSDIATITGDTTIDLNGTPGFPFGKNPSALDILLNTEFYAQAYAPYYAGSFDFGFDPMDPFGSPAGFLGYPHYSGFGQGLAGHSPLLRGLSIGDIGANSF